eukprot:7128013-Prymnesium_polylepis.1
MLLAQVREASSEGIGAGGSAAVAAWPKAKSQTRMPDSQLTTCLCSHILFNGRCCRHFLFNGRWPMLSPKAVSGHYARPVVPLAR